VARCEDLEPLIEAIADGSLELSPEDRAHLSSCAECAARIEQARRIEQWLSTREVAQPPATFTASVMARIGQQKWQTERVFDIGFNLAVAAGVLVIIAGALGLAWSLGVFTISVDVGALATAAFSRVEGRVISEVQTVVISAVVLTMALAFWWWAEAATD
jgi:anti-sigma factor RsiW